ncbi:MAG: hypothetical protein H7A37_06725 [Chlamydiales bacterium]|nr:hypothetical protein [Chlamydiales bacterium]
MRAKERSSSTSKQIASGYGRRRNGSPGRTLAGDHDSMERRRLRATFFLAFIVPKLQVHQAVIDFLTISRGWPRLFAWFYRRPLASVPD